MAEERLQKVLAAAGVASRRASEELIAAGRVRVNGKVVTEPGTKVDPEKAQIQVDGKAVVQSKRHVYIKLHKPRGFLSDIGGDARDRATVEKLLPPGVGRVFPVGRLDYNSEGLMLFTDDGALAHQLTHPRFEHPKIYYVLVRQHPDEEALNRLRSGVEIESGPTAPAKVEVVENLPDGLVLSSGDRRGVWLRFVLREGKKRQIRHMVAEVGVEMVRLVRWSIGSLTLQYLPPGEARILTEREVGSLRQMVSRGQLPRPSKKRPNQRRR
jgi:23S rRNA pseudouridine2605 synthase